MLPTLTNETRQHTNIMMYDHKKELKIPGAKNECKKIQLSFLLESLIPATNHTWCQAANPDIVAFTDRDLYSTARCCSDYPQNIFW